MTMKDLEKSCRCKYAKWGKKRPESTTAWIWCNLQNDFTDPAHCAKCNKRDGAKLKHIKPEV